MCSGQCKSDSEVRFNIRPDRQLSQPAQSFVDFIHSYAASAFCAEQSAPDFDVPKLRHQRHFTLKAR